MIIVLVVALLVPLLVYGSYRLQRARQQRSRRPDQRAGGGPPTSPERSVRDLRRLGYRYADDRVFVHGTGVFTGILLDTSTDEFATQSETADAALRPVGIYQTLLAMFDGKPVHCHELVRYRPATTQGWLDQLMMHAWHPTELYRVLAGKVAAHIAQATPRRLWALIVRVGDCPPSSALDPYAELGAYITGVAEERLTAADLNPLALLAQSIHEAAAGYGAEPLTRQDLIWLIRKPGHGHLPFDDEPVISRRPWRGGFFELAAQLRGRNAGGGYIELRHRDPHTGQDQSSYTATLVVADQPPRQIFHARRAWAKRLARLPVPAEISWRYTLIPPAQWKRLADKAVANVQDESDDRDKAAAATDDAFEARRDQAAQIKADNSDGDLQPGMVGRLRLTVSAATPQKLARAIKDVKMAMGDIAVEVPDHAALPLLQEQLPGETVSTDLGSLSAGPAGGLNLWQRWSDLYQPALGMIGSHNQVGDRIQVERGRMLGWIGIPFGYVKSNGTVASFDPHAQIARGHGAGVAILGASGGGKSSFALLMFFWASESGVRCSVLDPKIDFAGFAYYIAFGPQVLEPGFDADADAGLLGTPASRFQPVNRAFWDDTEIVDLARGARGSQDPWRITATFDDGYALALDLTDVLFTDAAHRSIVRKALRSMAAEHKEATAAGRGYRCGYGDVAGHVTAERTELAADHRAARERGSDTSALRQALEHHDEVSTRLEGGERVPFLRLLLAKGSDPPPATTAGHRRRVIYTMAGYRTPDHPENPQLWTDKDRNSSAVMLSVLARMRRDNLTGRLTRNPVTGQPGIPPTASIIDEGNMVTADPAGAAYIAVNLRQGRSLNAAVLFIDQATRGLKAIEKQASADTAEVNQFGTILAFKQRSKGEARATLAVLRSSDDDVPGAEVDALGRKLQSEEVGGALRIGDCVMRDPDSRVAVTTVDQMFWVLQRASQTNPTLKANDWAYPVPTDPGGWEINPEALLRVRTNIADAATEPADQPDEIAQAERGFDDDPADLGDRGDQSDVSDSDAAALTGMGNLVVTDSARSADAGVAP